MTLAFVEVIKAGGLGSGGLNFDAKIRRQSIDPADLVAAHVGGIDVCARAFLAAHRIVEEGELARDVAARYAGWDTQDARAMLAGAQDLAAIEQAALARGVDPKPRSGREEMLENLVNRYV